jgi:hypothetical protein
MSKLINEPPIYRPKYTIKWFRLSVALVLCLSVWFAWVEKSLAATRSGSVGLTGTISAPPPTTAATISVPVNGATFTTIPITVSGICPDGLLIKLFKNNVFSGSGQCNGGSFSIKTDLFAGLNELIARDYDALDQAGPDSNTVTVSYNHSQAGTGARISLSSNYAKRGSNPGETLVWPIILSGGSGPYAISVDWGDGKTPDLQSQTFPGIVNIQHVYDQAGVYNIIVKASDKDGNVAFLQLVGVANGPLSQDSTATKDKTPTAPTTKIRIIWQPAAILVPFIFSTFWLGRKYELKVLKKRIERGVRPF